MPWHRRGRRLLRRDREAKAAIVSFVVLGLAMVAFASVLFVTGETQLPETPAEQQVEGVHFGLEGPDATKEVTITWSTRQIVREPKLKWAPAGETPQIVWARNESWYYTGDLVHSVRLTGLEAGRTYQFWPGDEDWGYTGPYNYTVPDPSQGLRIAFWSNVGSGGTAAQNRDRLLALDPDIVVTHGNLAYAGGDPAKWRAWYETMEPLLGSRLHLAAVGSEERTEANYGKEAFLTTLALPSADEDHYFVRVGDLDLVVLDSGILNGGGSAAGTMLNWLGEHYRTLDPAVRWKVAVMHDAPFATNLVDNGRPLRDKVAPTLHNYGVQMAFTGHEGFYERTHVVSTGNNVITNRSSFVEDLQSGTIYWQTSGGGASLGTRGVKQDWLAHADTIHHTTVLDLNGNGTAFVRGVKAADGKEFDPVWLGLGEIPPAVPVAPPPSSDGNGTAPPPFPPPPSPPPPAPPADDFAEEPKEEPGFELVAAIVAVAALLFLRRRHRLA